MENKGDDEQVSCLDTLRGNGFIRWGIRKNVRYFLREAKEVIIMTSLNDEGESGSKGKERAMQGMPETQVEEKMVEVKQLRAGKRVRDGSSVSYEMSPKKIACRWSYERVESSKKALQQVVKEMDATWQKPVLRHDLREKARKHIGDTGLLDYLLKHMAGEVFSDGKERLIRRHNTEGAIEYWLEPAELAKIRQDAGITDAYWIPPAGWKPGDAISNTDNCHGSCKEMNLQLKEEINLLKSEVVELKSLKELMKSHQENHQRLLMQHGKLQDEVTAISIACLSMKEDLRLLKEEKMKKEQVTSEAGCFGDKHLMQEKEKGERAGCSVRKSAFRTYKRGCSFLWPNMASAGGTSAYSTSPAISLPPQLILLHSPTAPHPSLCPAFFSQPDSHGLVQNFSQAQSQAAIAQSPSRVQLVNRPTARYPPTGMTNSGASGMNLEIRDDVETDLSLASFNY
ncbi:hypothetical protein LUZ63_007071 [Rhynchospora breviuscula]|uniref:PTC1-like winged helix-turn-helix domain-containing protein n=1 Tax=Rhynchospora breviuscula TaxID=2022672 RepID=A0A9Q0CQZ4_9POAL|nr:hypothetical protein LUZ63_007071 [Rhynchospora breviuscula]